MSTSVANNSSGKVLSHASNVNVKPSSRLSFDDIEKMHNMTKRGRQRSISGSSNSSSVSRLSFDRGVPDDKYVSEISMASRPREISPPIHQRLKNSLDFFVPLGRRTSDGSQSASERDSRASSIDSSVDGNSNKSSTKSYSRSSSVDKSGGRSRLGAVQSQTQPQKQRNKPVKFSMIMRHMQELEKRMHGVVQSFSSRPQSRRESFSSSRARSRRVSNASSERLSELESIGRRSSLAEDEDEPSSFSQSIARLFSSTSRSNSISRSRNTSRDARSRHNSRGGSAHGTRSREHSFHSLDSGPRLRSRTGESDSDSYAPPRLSGTFSQYSKDQTAQPTISPILPKEIRIRGSSGIRSRGQSKDGRSRSHTNEGFGSRERGNTNDSESKNSVYSSTFHSFSDFFSNRKKSFSSRSRSQSKEPRSRGVSKTSRHRGLTNESYGDSVTSPTLYAISDFFSNRTKSFGSRSRSQSKEPRSRGVSKTSRNRGLTNESYGDSVISSPTLQAISDFFSPRKGKKEGLSRVDSTEVRSRGHSLKGDNEIKDSESDNIVSFLSIHEDNSSDEYKMYASKVNQHLRLPLPKKPITTANPMQRSRTNSNNAIENLDLLRSTQYEDRSQSGATSYRSMSTASESMMGDSGSIPSSRGVHVGEHERRGTSTASTVSKITSASNRDIRVYSVASSISKASSGTASSRGTRLSSDGSVVEVQLSNQPNDHSQNFELRQSENHVGTTSEADNFSDGTHALDSLLKVNKTSKAKFTRPTLRLDVNFESSPGIAIKDEIIDRADYGVNHHGAGGNGVASLFNGYSYSPRGIRNVDDVIHNMVVSKVQAKRGSISRIFSDLDTLQSPTSSTTAASPALPSSYTSSKQISSTYTQNLSPPGNVLSPTLHAKSLSNDPHQQQLLINTLSPNTNPENVKLKPTVVNPLSKGRRKSNKLLPR